MLIRIVGPAGRASRHFGAPIRFVRGVTLEPDTVRDFAAEHKLAIGTSFDEVLADPAGAGGDPGDAALQAPRAGRSGGRGRQAHLLRKAVRAQQGGCAAMLDACERAGIVDRRRPSFPADAVDARARRARASAAPSAPSCMPRAITATTGWRICRPTVGAWRRAESRAGGMTGMGIHVLDCFRDLVGPMKRISALSKARALKLPTGDTTAALIEFENGATGTLGTTHQDAVRLAHRGLWRELPGGKRERNARDRAPRRQRAGSRSTGRPTIISAAISIISPRPRSGRARSRFRRPAFCRRRRRSRRCSNRSMRMARG